MNLYYVAAIWLGMALLASVVSIRIAVPAALVEIVIGALAGNMPGIQQHISQTDVVTFLASVGSLVLTFLAGAEIDPVSLRGHWKASLSIGLASFALPFLAAFGFCWLVLGWQLDAADLGGMQRPAEDQPAEPEGSQKGQREGGQANGQAGLPVPAQRHWVDFRSGQERQHKRAHT